LTIGIGGVVCSLWSASPDNRAGPSREESRMGFKVDFNWASQAVIETVQIAFPSLERLNGSPDFADPEPPELEVSRSGPEHVMDFGSGRWNRDSSYRFNAGSNPDRKTDPKGEVGQLTLSDANRLVKWFKDRYHGFKPDVLRSGSKWNLYFTKDKRAYFFHIMVDLTADDSEDESKSETED
jgi:hypothetical protein